MAEAAQGNRFSFGVNSRPDSACFGPRSAVGESVQDTAPGSRPALAQLALATM